MGIDGRMMLYMKPYNNQDFDGQEAFDRLKEAVEKLRESTKGFSYEIKETTAEGDKPGTSAIVINVPDNRNFWFQLTQLPKLLIPRFWELSADELEKKRQKLIANDAWAIENLKKLSLDIVGLVGVSESYDSAAQGSYLYTIAPDSDTTASLDIKEGMPPHHPDAIRKIIKANEACAKAMRASGRFKDIVLNKSDYYGLWK